MNDLYFLLEASLKVRLPFDRLMALSKTEGLTVLSKVEGFTVPSKAKGLMTLCKAEG